MGIGAQVGLYDYGLLQIYVIYDEIHKWIL